MKCEWKEKIYTSIYTYTYNKLIYTALQVSGSMEA